jgi:cytochrome c-type biogenesis protein CcmH/NrfG
MTTANYYVLTEPFKELTEERPRVASEKASLKRRTIEAEPETRLWKVCAEAAAPRLSVFERTALFVFAVAAIVCLACCVFEWVQLYNTGSLDQVVRALLSR